MPCGTGSAAEVVTARAEDLDALDLAPGSFQLVRRYRWSVELDEHQVARLFGTFSDWSAEEVELAAAAVQDLGGRVVEHCRSWLLVLSPVRRP